MWKNRFFRGLGAASVLMMFFGMGLAIREFSRDIQLFYMWLAISILGFIGLVVIAIRIIIIQKRINTPRDKDNEKK